jgi:uncharacterized protein (TIGR02118 family)
LTEDARCDHQFRRCVSRPALDWETFSRDWAEVHAPLTRRIPGLRSNAQHHIRQAFVGYEKSCDATVALRFDDVRALCAAFAS